MKKKKIVLIAVLLVIIAGGIFIAKTVSNIYNNMNELETLTISNVDLSTIPEGTYSGSYKAFPVEAEVEVLIKKQQIIEIKIVRHQNGQGAKAEKIIDKVLDAQSLRVDTVSGATMSSKVILKAIENALNSSK